MIKIHEFVEEGVVEVCLVDTLSKGDFEEITPQIDRIISERKSICVLLDLRKFHGWESADAAKAHFAFVRGHQSKIERLALVTGESWQSWLGEALSLFVHPVVKSFPAGELDAAKVWVRKS